jgi:hypothetical protein
LKRQRDSNKDFGFPSQPTLGGTGPSDEGWLSVKGALQEIAADRDVSGTGAKKILVETCASSKVRSRYQILRAVDPKHVKIEYRGIHPGEWSASVVPAGLINFKTWTFCAVFVDQSEGPIEISASDLKKWLARPRTEGQGPETLAVSPRSIERCS